MHLLITLLGVVLISGCSSLGKTFYDKDNFNEVELQNDIDDCKTRMRGGMYGSDNMPSISFASGPYLTCMQSKGYLVVSCPSDAESPNDERCVKHSN